MRNVKYLPHFYSMYDHTGIRRHLEKMAAKGWMLEKTGTLLWKYHRIEPKKIHFAVNYFPKASEFQPEPSEEQQTLFDFCEQAGWKLVSTIAQMQIFCNEQENPVPLETDAAVQVEIISKAMKSSFLPAQIFLLVLSFFQMVLFLFRFFGSPISILTDHMNLVGGLCWIVVILLCGIELVNYFTWLKKARTAAERDGSFVETRSFPIIQVSALVLIFAVFILGALSAGNQRQIYMAIWVFGYMIILLGGVNLVKKILRSRKLSAGMTRTLTFVFSITLSFALMFGTIRMTLNFIKDAEAKKEGVETYEYHGMTWEIYHDELPFILEDFVDVDYKEYSYQMEVSETFLAAEYEANQRPKMDALEYPDLEYRIIKVKVPMLYDICFEALYKPQNWENANTYGAEEDRWYYATVDADLWQADAAYREYMGNEPQNGFLICWEDKIVEISFPTFEDGLREEYFAIAGEKLKNF